MKNISSAAFSDTKPHYELLDGLRGVAALLVVFYHIFEGLSFAAGGTLITVINHGYLAVDFFFILSGFVIGYAGSCAGCGILSVARLGTMGRHPYQSFTGDACPALRPVLHPRRPGSLL